MKYFITGGAGFIGSSLVDLLLARNHEVIVYDNFSTGCHEFLSDALKNPRLTVIIGDLLDKPQLSAAMKGSDFVFHLAANADVRYGVKYPSRDLQQNTIATFNVLEAMRENSIQKIAFSSTGSIYGEATVIPTPENVAFPVQTSLYGASKLACEGLIEAYCEGFGFQSWIFRFVSILGERYTHGHIFDFYKQLLTHPEKLEVLGNGHQKKSYLYILDCINAMTCAIEKSENRVNIFNLGTDEYCEVNDSIRWICDYLGVSPEIQYAGGKRGWVGDNPFIYLDCDKVRNIGWNPSCSIKEGVIRTVRYLQENNWLLQRR